MMFVIDRIKMLMPNLDYASMPLNKVFEVFLTCKNWVQSGAVCYSQGLPSPGQNQAGSFENSML